MAAAKGRGKEADRCCVEGLLCPTDRVDCQRQTGAAEYGRLRKIDELHRRPLVILPFEVQVQPDPFTRSRSKYTFNAHVELQLPPMRFKEWSEFVDAAMDLQRTHGHEVSAPGSPYSLWTDISAVCRSARVRDSVLRVGCW